MARPKKRWAEAWSKAEKVETGPLWLWRKLFGKAGSK